MGHLSVFFLLALTFTSVWSLPKDLSVKTGSIVFKPQTNGFGFVEEIVPGAIAQGVYRDYINQTGWATLDISTNGDYSDQDQAYWLGFLEGVLSYERIWQHYLNIFALDFGENKPSDELVEWVNEQKQFLEDNVATYGSSSAYWNQISLILQQFNGLVDGYNAISLNPISSLDLWLLNSDGDLETLLDIYPQGTELKARKLKEDGEEYTDCSALIKLASSTQKDKSKAKTSFPYTELFVGHTTWRSFAAMLRIYKFYRTQFSAQSGVASNVVAFSASPGFLSSKDDYYLTSSGLASLETTNSIYNETLYDLYISPKTVLTWQRSILANRLAKTSKDWVTYFAQYNSGTYNNQWMVVDYKVFETLQTSAAEPISDLLWIAEQIPGYVHLADVTNVLVGNGYWASYNVPYFEDIYDMSGYPEKYAQYGDKYSYSNCSRATIFRRDQANVFDIEDMKKIMRYNDYQHDPVSAGNPTETISSRYDLKSTASYRDAFGGIDSKLTSYELIQTLSGWAQNGPTHDQQTPFSWSNWTSSVSSKPQHIGLPDTYDFDFVFFPGFYSPSDSWNPIIDGMDKK